MLFFFWPFSFFQFLNDYCQKSYNGFQVFLGRSTTSPIFLIDTFLTKNGPFKFLSNLHRNAFGFFMFSK